MTPFIGQIMLFAGNFAPRGWMFCHGQLLPISNFSALFSILGTTYGGDGKTTFALPDLRGRAALSAGRGPGLSDHPLGQKSGQETVTLTAAQMPSHSHGVLGSNEAGNAPSPEGNVWGVSGTSAPPSGPYVNATPDAPMHAGAVANAGGSQPHDNMQPFLTLNYCIAVEGIFPSRG